MNHLAHLYLSSDQEEEMVGQFIADAVKGNDFNLYSPNIRTGILLHRWVDSFTDTHDLVKELRAAYRPKLGLYSGVLIDLVFDYFLAKDFHVHVGRELSEFQQFTFYVLNKHEFIFPEKMKKYFFHMKDKEFMMKYAHSEGMAIIVKQMGARIPHGEALIEAGDFFLDHVEVASNYFPEFFAELKSEFQLKREQLCQENKID
jgi:acyl carrier protein phosphodiesterase